MTKWQNVTPKRTQCAVAVFVNVLDTVGGDCVADTAGGVSERFSDHRGRVCMTTVLIRPSRSVIYRRC